MNVTYLSIIKDPRGYLLKIDLSEEEMQSVLKDMEKEKESWSTATCDLYVGLKEISEAEK